MEQLELTGSEADGDHPSPKGGRATVLPKIGVSLSTLVGSLIALESAVRMMEECWPCPSGSILTESVRSANGRLTVSLKRTSTTELLLSVCVADDPVVDSSDVSTPSDGWRPDGVISISEEEWNEEENWLFEEA